MTETETQFLAPAIQPDEDELERSLRPRSLDDFVGQERVKEQLAIALEATRSRGEALDHLLLAGPPGLGKTSLAQIVAAELDVPFVQTAGPALERKGDVAAFLTALEPGSVFFVDEIHRLPRTLARQGLVGLGFSAVEADELLADAAGATPEELIGEALRASR